MSRSHFRLPHGRGMPVQTLICLISGSLPHPKSERQATIRIYVFVIVVGERAIHLCSREPNLCYDA